MRSGREPTWGANTPPGEEVGADRRDIIRTSKRGKERIYRRMPHPAMPPLESLRAYRRNLAWLGDDYYRTSTDDALPDEGYTGSFNLCALHFLTETCFGDGRYPALDADMSLPQVIESLDEAEVRYWKAAVMKEARDDSIRSFARELNNSSNYYFPKGLGFDPDDPPHHSTFSRHWDYSPEEEAVIEEMGIRARYGALWVGAEFPEQLREQGWGTDEILSSEPSLDEKMVAMRHLVEEAIGVMSPHLSFGRETDSPAFKLTSSSFVSLFAHLALEKSYLKTGVRTLNWLDLPAPVPSPSTVRQYISELTVDQVDEMLTASTAALLLQEHETENYHVDPIDAGLESPIHLAYDTTKIEWYGDSTTAWTSNVLPRHNTASAWVFGVLSIVSENTSYVLGALPLKEQSEIGAYLSRFLRKVRGAYNIDIGRVYLDSELYTQEALHALRESDADFLIKAKDTGAVSDLLDDATAGEPESRERLSFGDLSLNRRPSGFAWPIPEEETGSEGRDRDHEPFLTDIDIDAADLDRLGRKFRDRWGVETSIREIKNRYQARCNSSDATTRAFYFMMATVLYNVSQYVDNRLAQRLYVDNVEWSGEELLHVAREIDPDAVPDWGDEYDPSDADDWIKLT